MGYVFGTQWTDDMVQAKILDCVSALGLKRMPSRAEFHDFYGSDALTNRIRRSGGYYDWADRLGLPMKESETQTGKDGEAIAKELLEKHGFTVKRMSTRYPYDLYVNGCVKVDVKTAHQTKTASIAKCYSFGLSKRCPTCDVYFLIALSESGNKVYIVPSSINQTQICMGAVKTAYEKYRDRYDIIRQLSNALSPSMNF